MKNCFSGLFALCDSGKTLWVSAAITSCSNSQCVLVKCTPPSDPTFYQGALFKGFNKRFDGSMLIFMTSHLTDYIVRYNCKHH